jgi:exodeoxyribonuclease VII large subunit
MEGNQALLGDATPVRSIAELYDDVARVLAEAFPQFNELWVRGEIQKISEHGGHAYIDVVDPESAGVRGAPVLKVKCWNRNWISVQRSLASQGLKLEVGMTVNMNGKLDFYKPRAEVGFILNEIDITALLGKIALERAALIDALKKEGLFEAQRALEVPSVPLRLGLVGSPNTEGFNDFLGQLERSGFSFVVTVVRSSVQGVAAPQEVARAIETLPDESIDLICVVRGGGSKGDLAAFDSPEIARAIARCPIPIWTGIGHTGDESVADLVANARSITPTACGGAVVERVANFWAETSWRAGRIAERASSTCREYEQAYATVRGQLVGAVRGHLRTLAATIVHVRRRLVSAPNAALRRARDHVAARSTRLVPMVEAQLDAESAALEAKRRLLSAYDPVQTLKRGWSLTLDDQGAIVRSLDQVAVGATVTTRVADGEFLSQIERKEER